MGLHDVTPRGCAPQPRAAAVCGAGGREYSNGMDPVTHTLVGASLAGDAPGAAVAVRRAHADPRRQRAGSGRGHDADRPRTCRLGFRRGWTHGALAIAAAAAAADRPDLSARSRRRPLARDGAAGAARPAAVAGVHRGGQPPAAGLAQHVRRALPDAVRRPLVLRRRAVHHGPAGMAARRRGGRRGAFAHRGRRGGVAGARQRHDAAAGAGRQRAAGHLGAVAGRPGRNSGSPHAPYSAASNTPAGGRRPACHDRIHAGDARRVAAGRAAGGRVAGGARQQLRGDHGRPAPGPAVRAGTSSSPMRATTTSWSSTGCGPTASG